MIFQAADLCFKYSFILSFTKHILRSCHVPNSILGTLGMDEMKYLTLSFHQCKKGGINKNKKVLVLHHSPCGNRDAHRVLW